MINLWKPASLLITAFAAAGTTAAITAMRVEISAIGSERTKLEAVVATVNGLMASERLWTNFTAVASQYPQIYIGPDFGTSGTADASRALALLRGRSAHRTFPAYLGLTGTYYPMGQDFEGQCRRRVGNAEEVMDCRATAFGQNYSNQFVATHGIGLRRDNQREIVSIEIGRELFDRYNSPSPIRRSCTYNTVAHEWTHTIGRDQNTHWAVVEDPRSAPAGVPRLSYLFGSVVQCTWLQQRRHIGPGTAELRACVTRFGIADFQSSQCT